MTIPKKQQVVLLREFKSFPEKEEYDVPSPGDEEILVNVKYAPINPQDLAYIMGYYSATRNLPIAPGFEGSGIVVSTGKNAKEFQGKRVSWYCKTPGSYSQFRVLPKQDAFSIPDDVSYKVAACSFVNPVTVLGFYELVQKHKANCIVVSVAQSAIGKMIIRYMKVKGIRTINIVRSDEQIKILKELEQAEHVLNQESESFKKELRVLCNQFQPTVFLDALSGPLTQSVLEAMPENSTAYVYGGLSMKPSSLGPSDLIFQNKSIQGFWSQRWIYEKTYEEKISIVKECMKHLDSIFKTNIQKEYAMEDFSEAVMWYRGNMSAGKVVIKIQEVK